MQGAGLALAAAVDADRPIGGVVALSPLLPPWLVRLSGLRGETEAEAEALARVRAAGAGLRVLVCEGGQDRVAPGEFARRLYRWMTEQGARVEVEGWAGMGHEVAVDELCRVREFLCDVLPPQPLAAGRGPPTGLRKEAGVARNEDGAQDTAGVRAEWAGDKAEREAAAAGGARAALSGFVAGWSDPAAAVWAAALQRGRP